MAELLCPGLSPHAVSEFFMDGATTPARTINGACGPNAVYHALCVHNRVTPSESGFQAFLRAMRSAGYCGPTGITTMANMLAYLAKLGFPLLASLPWTGADQTSGVQKLLDAHAGLHPLLYQTSRGQAFWDVLTNTGERAVNLQSHFVCVVGQHTGGYSPLARRTLPAGYWVADGDALAVPWGGVGSLVFYPVMTMQATHPIAAAVVALPSPKPVPVVVAPKPAPKPATPTQQPDAAHVLAEIKSLVAPF